MVIILRTFYVFKLKKNYTNIAASKPNNIYIMLKSIYSYKKKDIIVAFNLFDELCSPINIEFLNKYIYDKLKNNDSYTKFKNVHMFHDYFTDEESKMSVLKSHIKIKSTKENNIFINNISYLTNLFVCDFIFNKYNYFDNNKYNFLKLKNK